MWKSLQIFCLRLYKFYQIRLENVGCSLTITFLNSMNISPILMGKSIWIVLFLSLFCNFESRQIMICEWVRLQYGTTHHHPPPAKIHPPSPTITYNHSPPFTTTHQQPKYIHHHPPPPTTSQNISNTMPTTLRQPNYIHHHQQQTKIYPSKRVFYKKNNKTF